MIQKTLLYILGLLLSGNLLFAQTVIIPDSGFKACLVEKRPELLDASQNLITSQAQAFSGNLACIGYSIKNAEGIQYFTNTVDINLSGNAITEINSFPVSNKLTRLVLDDNQLSTLPSISVLPELKTFTVRRNRLTVLPDLSANTKMTQLYVQSNKLTYIPDLRNLKELWAVNFSDNLLTSLPFLDSLKKLRELVVAKNSLFQVQPLDQLTSLTLIDFSNNQMSSLPAVAISNQIETIKLNDNNFENLPDFSVFPTLKNAYLDNNYFTFEDLQPLISISNYKTVFPMTVQKTIQSGKNYNINENESLYIKTNIDLNTPDIVRTWYFENNQIQQSSIDSLKVLSDTTANTGSYYCILTSENFPGLIIKTSNYKIKIDPCFTITGLIIKSSSGSCNNNGGKIEIKSTVGLPYNFTYKLVSQNGLETFESKSGHFNNLGSTEYTLYGVVDNCQKIIESNIVLDDEACENAYITADGDGENDVYFFKGKGMVTISDKFGNTVYKQAIPGKWNGMSNKGLVAPGLYYANINNGEKLIKITVVY